MTLEDIALTFVRQLGARGTVHLLDVFGDARSVYAAGVEELVRRAELRDPIARRIAAREGFAEAERELAYCEKHGIRPVASTDADYPETMLHCTSDYPHVIYVMGDIGALHGRMLSIVGTRRCSVRSEPMCNALVGELAQRVENLKIVSGIAFGVDSYVHRAALAAGIPSVAILPSALPNVTPAQHFNLAMDIVSHGGALVSELDSARRPSRNYYIARNRLIAALGEGTLVVESHEKGGSLHTARLADSYNRTVMAVPGRPADPQSAGTNALIRENAAHMVCSADHILTEMDWAAAPRSTKSTPRPELTTEERRIAECLASGEALSADAVAMRSGIEIDELSYLLLEMELNGIVRRLPGDNYEICP